MNETKVYCDICNKLITVNCESEHTMTFKQGDYINKFDLCPNCFKVMYDFFMTMYDKEESKVEK